MHKWVNALGFQLVWWMCIASVSRGLELQAMGACALLMTLHLYGSKTPLQEIKLAVFAGLLGIFVDSLLQYSGVIAFGGMSLGALSPFWLWTLWVAFGFTLNASLDFLKHQNIFTVALLGLVLGPLNYYAGARWGAAQLSLSGTHLLALGVVWLLALPTLVCVAKQLFPHHPEQLNAAQIRQKITQLDGWNTNASHTCIEKEWNFPDFPTAVQFFCRVGDFAHAQDHHPEVFSSYTTLRIKLFTHDTQGLTEKDFALAGAIDALARLGQQADAQP